MPTIARRPPTEDDDIEQQIDAISDAIASAVAIGLHEGRRLSLEGVRREDFLDATGFLLGVLSALASRGLASEPEDRIVDFVNSFSTKLTESIFKEQRERFHPNAMAKSLKRMARTSFKF